MNKLDRLKELKVNPYPHRYEVKNKAEELKSKFKKLKPGDKVDEEVTVAGRILFYRDMGKASFIHIQDFSGRIQAYVRKNDVGDHNYEVFKNLEVGDHIGVKGTIFKTQKGELSVYAKEITCLGKSLRSLPEKFHGLKDKEIRYRQRYLDLIMNPEVKEVFKQRTVILNTIRNFLNEKGFIEVDTPVLQPLYGGTNAKPFETHINAFDMKMYLRVAPELYLKRLVVGGFEKVYEIARNFRNEGADWSHNPEFSMIEWYQSYADYNDMMDTAEEMMKHISRKLYGCLQVPLGEEKVDLSGDWPRVSITELVKKQLNIDYETATEEELKNFAEEKDLEIVHSPSKGTYLYAIFDKLIADNLKGPIWVVDYPKEVSPLSKPHRSKPGFVERFECYVKGKEMGDGWSEIIDPIEQRERFDKEQEAMRQGHDEAHPVDEDFIKALEYGMPTLGGIGMGIDRLCMFFTNNWSIRDVMLFPIMKPAE